ncbi:efflux transporter outer membrane subunit [Pseudomonas sp. TH31]|uniref:efflux transporter outer membrane subunit n=1 Tax=Pseudomonas sp. TH31 TaxID=2796396 RepID=UPI00191172C3|nr:efflux transporter outer membrane subunit [Pseudomonas sp. TH31]MBK5416218.1 efflux transporter outer membrane subunit [Pseudomonas sp. TH31]
MLLSGCGLLRGSPPAPAVMPAHWLTNVPEPSPSRAEDFWSSLGDPGLQTAQAIARRQNNDLRLSELQLKLSRLQASLTDLSLWPGVSLGASAGVSRPLASVGDFPLTTSRSAGVGASLSYPLDIWGAQQAARQAAQNDAQASEVDWQTVRLTLNAAVAETRWQSGYLNRTVANARLDLETAQETLRLAQVRWQIGASAWSDVVFAQQALEGQQSALSQDLQQRDAARTAFAVLMGDMPETPPPELQDLPDTPLPVPDVGLPASLLARRPDVRAAELRVRSSLANADATRLNFYPSLALTANYGTSSPTLTNYLSNPVGSLAAALTLPFVQFNTARLTNAQGQVAVDIASVSFRKTLYTALQQVEDALSACQRLNEQATSLRKGLVLSREAERLSQVRWQQGASDIQSWLDAQRARRQAELSLLQNTLLRRNNAVDLYTALGGDYHQVGALP